MDQSDAVNLMTYASDGPNGERGYALWHIFPRESANGLRTFLRAHTDQVGVADPIHAQQVYLKAAMLDILAQAPWNIHATEIRQFAGNAVFIPAGCAHQASQDHTHCRLSDTTTGLESSQLYKDRSGLYKS